MVVDQPVPPTGGPATVTAPAAPPAGAVRQRGSPVRAAVAVRVRVADLRSRLELFVVAPPVRPTPRRVALAVGAVLLGTATSLARTRGPGALNTIWAEDGQNLLADAVNLPWYEAIARTINGYFLVGPRLLAEVADPLPVEWGAAVLSTEAALATSLLGVFVYVASRGYLAHPALRVLVAGPVMVAPAGLGMVENNLATLQFPLLYAMFWALLWVPLSRMGRVAAALVVLFTVSTTPLAVLLLPLALLRCVVRRDAMGWVLAALIGLGGLAQLALPLFGWVGVARQVGWPRYDLTWALGHYLTKALPVGVLGESWLFDPSPLTYCPRFGYPHPADHWALVGTSWLAVAGVLAVAIRRARGPAWALAAVAIGHSVLLWVVPTMLMGCPTYRYLVAPALLVVAAAAALLRTSPTGPAAGPGTADAGATKLPASTIAVLAVVAMVCAANLRADTPRSTLSPPWTELVSTARQRCATSGAGYVVVTTTLPHWQMALSCSRLRR